MLKPTVKWLLAACALLACVIAVVTTIRWWRSSTGNARLRYVSTVAGLKGEFGEPFGIAIKGSDIYVSDGQNGKIWLIRGDAVSIFADGFDTPSGIAFAKNGDLLVADSGTNTIMSVDRSGTASTVAGVAGKPGFADGDAAASLFNGPIGIAVADDGKIFVADTYNDRIRVIERGNVSTIAGSTFGYADGVGPTAKFHTPCGIAIWHDKLLVADAGNRRIRVVGRDGDVWTLAGNGGLALKDGLLLSSSFVQPTAIAVDHSGALIVADGNAIRQIGGDVIPLVRTINNETRGTRDGLLFRSRYNRPSGIAIDDTGEVLIADSDNRLVRRLSAQRSGHELTSTDINSLREKPEEFRALQPPRWPFDPPERVREIAGTMGELRGDVPEHGDIARFHNGLDIAGGYGETARFVRSEKVLEPIAAENFNTLRELLRMPSVGYIHVRLGRDASSKPFGDPRFQFDIDALGKRVNVRVRRGTRFIAGEPIGTLNAMNHVHLIAGRSGFEMNALDALILPGIRDTKPPVIESVQFFNADNTLLPKDGEGRVVLDGKTRIVMRSYDQTDGNAARRRLGLHRAGYQLLRTDQTPLKEVIWTIKFDQMPSYDAAKLVYADGSHSGATGETIFNYIVTNRVDGETAVEDYFDPTTLADGNYVLRVMAADYFGNQSYIDTPIDVKRTAQQ